MMVFPLLPRGHLHGCLPFTLDWQRSLGYALQHIQCVSYALQRGWLFLKQADQGLETGWLVLKRVDWFYNRLTSFEMGQWKHDDWKTLPVSIELMCCARMLSCWNTTIKSIQVSTWFNNYSSGSDGESTRRLFRTMQSEEKPNGRNTGVEWCIHQIIV